MGKIAFVSFSRSDESPAGLGTELTDDFWRSIDSGLRSELGMLKFARRRRVFRLSGFSIPLVVKAFPLDFIARFRYRKYAWTELLNYREAEQRGISIPTCFGYFERRSFGLVDVNGVLLEDLIGWRSLRGYLHQSGPEEERARGLVVGLIAAMFGAGVNHIDTTPDNFLLSPDLREAKLIDWQYASFVAPRQNAQLLLQLGRLLSYGELEAVEASTWLSDVHTACRLDIPLGDFANRVRSVRQVKQPFRDRLALKVRGLPDL